MANGGQLPCAACGVAAATETVWLDRMYGRKIASVVCRRCAEKLRTQ